MTISCEDINIIKAIKTEYDILYDYWKENPHDYEQPAIFLKKWMNKKGGVQRFPERILAKDKIILRHLETFHISAFLGEWYEKFEKSLNNKPKYQGGITRVIKDLNKKKGTIPDEMKMKWEDSIDYQGIIKTTNLSSIDTKKVASDIEHAGGNPNIYFALGNFTLVSSIKVSTKVSSGKLKVHIIKWQISLKDSYDFKVDSERQELMAKFNNHFRKAHCYERYGFAKPFNVESDWTYSPEKKEYFLSIK